MMSSIKYKKIVKKQGINDSMSQASWCMFIIPALWEVSAEGLPANPEGVGAGMI